jgi:hypothetical protein
MAKKPETNEERIVKALEDIAFSLNVIRQWAEENWKLKS